MLAGDDTVDGFCDSRATPSERLSGAGLIELNVNGLNRCGYVDNFCGLQSRVGNYMSVRCRNRVRGASTTRLVGEREINDSTTRPVGKRDMNESTARADRLTSLSVLSTASAQGVETPVGMVCGDGGHTSL